MVMTRLIVESSSVHTAGMISQTKDKQLNSRKRLDFNQSVGCTDMVCETVLKAICAT